MSSLGGILLHLLLHSCFHWSLGLLPWESFLHSGSSSVTVMETATSTLENQKHPSIQGASQVAFDSCKNCIYYQCVNSELFSIKLFLALPYSAPLPQGCFHSSSVVLSSLPQSTLLPRKWSRLFTALGLSLCSDEFAGTQIPTLPSLKGFPKAQKQQRRK